MPAEDNAIPQLLNDYNQTAAELVQLARSFTDYQINTVPFENSWTAAQVIDHVTKSNTSIWQSVSGEGAPTDRDPAQAEPHIKAQFLNFDVKMKSPDFILPDRGTYQKDLLIGDLAVSIDQLKETSRSKPMAEITTHPALGPATRLEQFYFILYHTQRHIHQLKHIRQSLSAS
jgi:hypothetical protein